MYPQQYYQQTPSAYPPGSHRPAQQAMYTPQQQQQQGQPASYGHHVGMAAAQHAAYNIMGNPNMAGMSVHTRDQIAAYHAQQQHQQMASGTIVRKRTNEFNDAAVKHAKKKRPTDRSMPSKIETFVPESRLYNELVEFEKRLDATIMRKRLDIQEAMGKPVKTKRTLRVFLSNMASDQPSQLQSDADEDNVDLGSGGAPSWTLKIEGRLLDPPTTNNKKQQPGRKFTSFLSSIVVELERDPNLYPDGNLIEWKFPAGSDHDGVEIKRRGDSNVKARIILQLDYSPQKFKLSPELAEMLSLQMETKPGIVMAVWQYVKHHKLQDTDDKRIVRCDLRMQQVFRVQQLYFAQVPELLAPHLILPDPIILEYIIRVDKEYHLSRHAYDIDIEVDDAIRAKMASVVASTATQKEIMTLDEKIVQCVQSVNNSKIKRDFLLQFATSPVDFINKWVASQARDLEIILGESRVNLEEMRRTDFYRQDWVKEAVFHYMTAKTQQRMQELLSARQ